jgi:hypothetical protein
LQRKRAFVAAPPVKKESILLNVNMDMVSRSDKNELYAVGNLSLPVFKTAARKLRKTRRIKLLLGHDRPEQGQQRLDKSIGSRLVSRGEKIPFIYFGVEDHKDYHKPTDDFANINQEFYVRAVETILAVIKIIR